MSAVLECWCFGDPWYRDEYIPRQNFFTNLAQALHAIANILKKNEGYMLHTGAVILPLLIIMHHK
jgi:hypothetical protein